MANIEKKSEKSFDCLSVTAVKVELLSDKIGKRLGVATVVLNDQLRLSGLRIIDSDIGMLVCYPPNTLHNGVTLHAAVFPITRELRDHITNCVLEKYKYEKEHANFKFDVALTHQNLSGASLQMEIIAPSEAEAKEKAKEQATTIIPATKTNGEWTILKVTKHE